MSSLLYLEMLHLIIEIPWMRLDCEMQKKYFPNG